MEIVMKEMCIGLNPSWKAYSELQCCNRMTPICGPGWLILVGTVWILQSLGVKLTDNSLFLSLSYPLEIWSKQLSHRWLCRKCQVLERLDCHSWFSKRSYQKEMAVVQAGSTQRPALERVIQLHKRDPTIQELRFLNLLLHSVCCEMLPWGKYMKKM